MVIPGIQKRDEPTVLVMHTCHENVLTLKGQIITIYKLEQDVGA
jgi:hypothetical protein